MEMHNIIEKTASLEALEECSNNLITKYLHRRLSKLMEEYNATFLPLIILRKYCQIKKASDLEVWLHQIWLLLQCHIVIFPSNLYRLCCLRASINAIHPIVWSKPHKQSQAFPTFLANLQFQRCFQDFLIDKCYW